MAPQSFDGTHELDGIDFEFCRTVMQRSKESKNIFPLENIFSGYSCFSGFACVLKVEVIRKRHPRGVVAAPRKA